MNRLEAVLLIVESTRRYKKFCGPKCSKTISRDEAFAIVCEGWGRVNRSVVWFGEITNWWDGGMQATWATGREV